MIHAQLKINQTEVEDALVDVGEDEPSRLIELITAVVEQIQSPELIKELIGKLGDAYTYLEETFGDGTD